MFSCSTIINKTIKLWKSIMDRTEIKTYFRKWWWCHEQTHPFLSVTQFYIATHQTLSQTVSQKSQNEKVLIRTKKPCWIRSRCPSSPIFYFPQWTTSWPWKEQKEKNKDITSLLKYCMYLFAMVFPNWIFRYTLSLNLEHANFMISHQG